MSTDTLPPSIRIYEAEGGYLDDGLRFDYIDGLAGDLAGILQTDVAECVYQPGDGTRYPLVVVPLFALRHGRPRRDDNGHPWERHAVSGMASRSRSGDDAQAAEFYGPNSYLVVWVEHAAYPIRLGGRRGTIAASYVAEHWSTTLTSAVSLAVLLRSVSAHLDDWPNEPRRSTS